MLIPKRVKYRKMHRGRRTGIATQGATVAFGDFGLQAMEACWMSNRQIEAARRAMTRHVKRGGQIWIRVFPDKSITKKPAETRMGSGKGNPEGWVAVIKPGRVLFEMGGVQPQVAKDAMKLAAAKLPIKTRFVTSADGGGPRSKSTSSASWKPTSSAYACARRAASSMSFGTSTRWASSRTRARSRRSGTTSRES